MDFSGASRRPRDTFPVYYTPGVVKERARADVCARTVRRRGCAADVYVFAYVRARVFATHNSARIRVINVPNYILKAVLH